VSPLYQEIYPPKKVQERLTAQVATLRAGSRAHTMSFMSLHLPNDCARPPKARMTCSTARSPFSSEPFVFHPRLSQPGLSILSRPPDRPAATPLLIPGERRPFGVVEINRMRGLDSGIRGGCQARRLLRVGEAGVCTLVGGPPLRHCHMQQTKNSSTGHLSAMALDPGDSSLKPMLFATRLDCLLPDRCVQLPASENYGDLILYKTPIRHPQEYRPSPSP
jgi:hypothetical protein